MAEQHAKVVIDGDASGAQVASREAKRGIDQLDKSVTRASAATDKLAKSAKSSGVSLDQMRSQVMASMEVMKKAVSVIDAITEAEIAAGGGADIFTQSWIGLKKTLNDPAFYKRVKDGLADVFTAMDPFQQMALQLNRGIGDNRRGIGFRQAGNTVRALQSQIEAKNLRDQADLTAALLGSMMEGERVRKEHLEHEKGITAQLTEQKDVVDSISASHRENELGRLQAARERAIAQREEPFEALQGQFGEARAGFEDSLEQARQAKHDAELARIEQLKQAEEERIGLIERNVSIGQQAAEIAVAGILDVAGARRDAIRVAKLQGATDREAAQAGRIATMMALEAQLKSLRNMAAMHAIEYYAKGIASQASTYGIPNPQSIGYFTAAGVFTTLAVGAGLGAMGVGMAGDGMQMRSGGGSGFGGGGFGGGSAANSGPVPRSGPAPIDSSIPGSPGPQAPSSGGSPAGSSGSPVMITGNTYHLYGAAGRKEYIRQLDQDLDAIRFSRRRAG